MPEIEIFHQIRVAARVMEHFLKPRFDQEVKICLRGDGLEAKETPQKSGSP